MDTDEPKPIPAYYCCYLLRSTVRHASLYVGSTPNPSRRLPQHNGDAKGGAKRTARDNLRPWEMTLLVEGFMSRVGALQFEWAWQHTDHTRHVDSDDEAELQSRANSSKAKPAKPRARTSRRSLAAHLADLHALLRSPSFSSWPLRVRFFCADVYRVWRVWNDRVDVSIPADKTILDGDCPKREGQDPAVGDINKLAVDYAPLEDYLEKSMFILEDAEDIRCAICTGRVAPHTEQVVVCSQAPCRAASHLLCLSATFLDAEGDPSSLVPKRGMCPTCKKTVQWPTMMRELTLRNRGDKDARALLAKKERRERKKSAKPTSTSKPKTREADESKKCTKSIAIAKPHQKGADEELADSGFVFPSGFTLPP
ncbi:hypothetical protein N7492_002517 [Penicillium capsulatum]|uniref:GIY-YIG domain-containing protein n=1 Tax=Penicillium capsulatum TaxID=69766 RepID=A0A9W9IK89_9EURO|nr:hypothetical protein N7492_002517 [Penicillium capsulatum]